MERGTCSFPGGCDRKIISSHTVQRKGGLAAIQEDGHVYGALPEWDGLFDGEAWPPPRRVGNRRASTFPGFCSEHDTVMFKPIEGDTISFDTQSAFLFSFRAVAFELQRKLGAIAMIDNMRMLDKGWEFERQAHFQLTLQVFRAGNVIGLRDSKHWKKVYDDIYRTSAYGKFEYYAIVFDSVLPIVTCGGFAPEFDFDGVALQELSKSIVAEMVTLNITAIDGRTVAVFGWVGKPDGAAQRFVHGFARLPEDRKAEALVRVAFEYLENVFMRESWWDGLSSASLAAFNRHREGGLPMVGRQARALVDDGLVSVTGRVVAESASERGRATPD